MTRASSLRFGKHISTLRFTRSRVHHSPNSPTAARSASGARLRTTPPRPCRHLLLVCSISPATRSSPLCTASAAFAAGRTERKSSGMCDAAPSAVVATAVESGPSDASVSSAARSGEVGAPLRIGARMSCVGFAGSGVAGFGGAGVGAAGHALFSLVWRETRRELTCRCWLPSPQEELVILAERQQRLAAEGRPHVRVVLLVREQRLPARSRCP